MNIKFKSSLLVAAGVIALAMPAMAQTQGFTIPNRNGSVYANLKGRDIKSGDLANNLPVWQGLNADHTYKEIKSTSDKLGYTHRSFQQYYKNVLIDGGVILVHAKDGVVTAMNGRVAPIAQLSATAAISSDNAIGTARRTLEVVTLIRQHPETLLITSVPSADGSQYVLAYKVRVDGRTLNGKVRMSNVYINAETSAVIKTENLIAHADVEATGHTLFNGIQTFTTDDSDPAGFRLRDNARNIETYDVTSDEMTGINGTMFDTPKDIFNSTTIWEEQPALVNIQLTEANNSMLTGLGFQTGAFLTSFVVKGGIFTMAEGDFLNWPDVMLAQAPMAVLPLGTNNIYGFPGTDTSFVAGFGKVDIFSNDMNMIDSTMFIVENLNTPGVYNWSDTAGYAGTYEIALAKNPALDAHWGMGETHDYFMSKFDRNSYDGNGSVVRNYMNGIWPMMLSQNNAAALPAPDNAMVYGLGDGILMDAVVGLDVMGHEFTHMVTENNGNNGLQYAGESGALNESFSDIFGASIEFRTKGAAANWLIGEDVILVQPGFLRSMSDPKAPASAGNPNFPPQPDTYGKQYWVDPSNMQNDNGGVHINSGIQNKWFYLLCEGGTGTNDNSYTYNVSAIGMEKAEQIAYRNLTTYLVSTSNYQDAFNGSIQATIDLFGENSAEVAAVEEAWKAVGVLDPNAIGKLDILAHAFNVYPNPSTTGQFTIASANHEVVKAQLFNIVGKSLLQFDVKKGLNSFSTSNLPKGLYMLKLTVGNDEVMKKISVL